MRGYTPEMSLSLEECLTIAMAAVLDVLILVSPSPGGARLIFVLNLAIAAAVLLTAHAQSRWPYPWLQVFRDWYVIPLLIVIYLENGTLIPLVNPRVMDSLVIAADRLLFLGRDPTLLIQAVEHPVLSEVLQIAYATFYFLPVALCAILYFGREGREDFHIAASTILLGFYLSYLGYYLTPVLGPRFSMEHLYDAPLTGLWSFDFIRGLLARAEGRMLDCMPSGHALVSVLTVLLARRYARGFFPVALAWTLLLLLSTVYLRYHYVTDLVAGIALCALVFRVGPVLAGAAVSGGVKDLCPSGAKQNGDRPPGALP